MASTSKAHALRLASLATEAGAETLRGTLRQDEEGRWLVGFTEVGPWLARHAGTEVVLVIASIEEAQAAYSRTCRTCGTLYSTPTCPHCKEVRNRLRGG
ncbi:MAG TPA: hypothetical protein PKO09_04585 [Anaerolineae bacterium]|nr:hypothetical protein [Anaerolineae bacterium]